MFQKIKTYGSTPAEAYAIILANGFAPTDLAKLSDARTIAAAPSFIPEAFPAVTVPLPSLIKAGLKFLSPSNVVSGLGNSSVVTVTLPFLPGTSIGTISSLKYPSFMAIPAFL